MHTVSRARLVDQRPEQVWERLADFAAIGSWAGAVDHSASLSAPASGPGAVRRVQLGRHALRERVVAWQPPVRLGYAVEGLPPVVRSATTTWTVTPAGAGARVTVTCELSTRPALVAPVVGRRFARTAERLLADLSAAARTPEVLR